jgi:ABC-type transporter Mla subunit MlaD
MIQTFKLRYVNEIVGIFVLVALGFVVAGIVAALGREWFQPVKHLTVDLPPEGSLGLKPGSQVYILGTVVGQVDAIAYEKGRMQAKVSIRGNLIELVRTYSQAMIDKPLGFGEPYITIERDNPDWESEPPLPADKHIPGYANAGPTEKLTQLAGELQKQAIPAVQEARAAIREYTQLAADLRDPKKPLQQTIAHLGAITGSIEKGEGLVGRLLSDPKMAEQISAMLPKLNNSLDQMADVLKGLGKTSGNLADITATAKEDLKRLPALLDTTQESLTELTGTMKDIRKTTANLPAIVEGAGQTVAALPGVVLQLQETLRQMQILVEGVQKSWLVRSYIDKGEPNGRIRADEIGGGR